MTICETLMFIASKPCLESLRDWLVLYDELNSLRLKLALLGTKLKEKKSVGINL